MRADAALRSDVLTVNVRRPIATSVAGVVLAASGLAATAAPPAAHPVAGGTGVYPPLHPPGPPPDLRSPPLRQTLRCTDSVRHATRNPILLVPGTNLDPAPNFSW